MYYFSYDRGSHIIPRYYSSPIHRDCARRGRLDLSAIITRRAFAGDLSDALMIDASKLGHFGPLAAAAAGFRTDHRTQELATWRVLLFLPGHVVSGRLAGGDGGIMILFDVLERMAHLKRGPRRVALERLRVQSHHREPRRGHRE